MMGLTAWNAAVARQRTDYTLVARLLGCRRTGGGRSLLAFATGRGGGRGGFLGGMAFVDVSGEEVAVTIGEHQDMRLDGENGIWRSN